VEWSSHKFQTKKDCHLSKLPTQGTRRLSSPMITCHTPGWPSPKLDLPSEMGTCSLNLQEPPSGQKSGWAMLVALARGTCFRRPSQELENVLEPLHVYCVCPLSEVLGQSCERRWNPSQQIQPVSKQGYHPRCGLALVTRLMEPLYTSRLLFGIMTPSRIWATALVAPIRRG
jgi:hypothetical protein